MSEFTLVGERTFQPDDFDEVIGSFTLQEGHDTLWVRITQMDGTINPPFAFGILGWRSTDGYELGSVKAFGKAESEIYRLGVGRSPSVRTGNIVFTPRGFNLGWIKEGTPWTLRFSAASGKTAGVPAQTVGAVVNSFVDTSDNGISLVRVNFP